MIDFYLALGFRLTDRMGGVFAWLRSNVEHHSVAIVDTGAGGGLDHYSFDLNSWDDFKVWADRLTDLGIQRAVGTWTPRSRQQPVPVLRRPRRQPHRAVRRDGAVLRRPGATTTPRIWNARAEDDQPVGRPAAAAGATSPRRRAVMRFASCSHGGRIVRGRDRRRHRDPAGRDRRARSPDPQLGARRSRRWTVAGRCRSTR